MSIHARTHTMHTRILVQNDLGPLRAARAGFIGQWLLSCMVQR